MNKETIQKVWLGIFVLTGLIFLSIIFYYLGNRQNFFDRTIAVHAIFKDVGGLRPGNNVRLSGINIGTVQKVEIMNDSLVRITMGLEADLKPFIKKNATVSVGTDGLMGNRIVHIHPGNSNNPYGLIPIEPGDTLQEEPRVELEDMLAVLEETNLNIALMANDMVSIIHKISSGEGSVGRLISDPQLVIGLEGAINNMQSLSNKGNQVLDELNTSVRKINQGEGMIGTLLSDTSMVENLSKTLMNIEKATNEFSLMSEDLHKIIAQAQSQDGAIGTMLTNPKAAKDIEITLENIREGSAQFNEVMEGLKHNFLLRRYFKKKAKQEKRATNGPR